MDQGIKLTKEQQRNIRNIVSGQARPLDDPAANYPLAIKQSQARAQGKSQQVSDEA
jgi:hypothetical protein